MQFKAVGKHFKMEKFNQIKKKFWAITTHLQDNRFHISTLKVFDLIDQIYLRNNKVSAKNEHEEKVEKKEKELGALSIFMTKPQ